MQFQYNAQVTYCNGSFILLCFLLLALFYLNICPSTLSCNALLLQAPDASERQNILEDLTAFLPKHTDVDLEYLAEHTAGLFYGDLQALVTHAERNAMRRAHAISRVSTFRVFMFIQVVHFTREGNSEHKALGCVNQEAINRAKILVSSQDFDEGLDTIQGVQSLDLGTPKIPNVKWKDIGGLADVKKDILDTIQLPLRHPELFMSTMRRSGVLLYGPPGTGKTLLAKAVATECALNFFSVKGPELINMYVGQSEENIRQVFQKARSASPCVIFFDELDSLAPNRGKSGDSGGVMDRVVSQLLAELDGLVKSCDVFVIGATNRPDLLDSALLRPGRFDKLVYVGISSTSKEQLTILKAITRKFELDPDCELEKVANTLPSNLTGADLYSLCSEATTNCIKRMIDLVDLGTSMEDCKLKVNLDDFMKAAESITPSLSANEIKKYEQLRYQFSLNAKNKDSEKVVEEKSMEIDNIEELLQVVGKGVNNSIPPAGDGSGEEVTGSSTDM
ncbi:PEX6 [Bugula neritina]|uniref:Peroxisomal ATPase PEX6 n=1 Tax=Bugula neritina TaxID=10212 RepID=A0A7J7JJG1_BUGNE|nr:PEX6 [Bugula neritina]